MSLELKAKEILESGEIKLFEEFITQNYPGIKILHLFTDRIGFPVILIQTYRKTESLNADRSNKLFIDDYKHCLRFLVEMGCSLDVQDGMGRTFSHWTIVLNCVEFLAIALELDCNTILQDSEGETIVHLAIRHNNHLALETIKLYSNTTNVFEIPSKTSGATPLIYAVQIGAFDIVKKLLQFSVNVDSQESNQYKRTALHYALFTDNEEIFKLLLEYKARSDIKDYKDKSVMDRAAEHPKDNFLKIITQYSSSEIISVPTKISDKESGYSPITLACKNGDYDKLCQVLEKLKTSNKKINLNPEDEDLRTPLHHCADNPDIRCAEKLLEFDPKLVEKKDKNGFTPLHLATMANNKNLVQLLLKKGCKIKEKDNEGHTSLHWAVVCCATELIDLLLKADPSIARIIDNHGASPLHYATQSFLNPKGSVQGPMVIEKLLKNNKDLINSVDLDNRTPLLWAATLGITECCRILMNNGANKNHKDNNGLSALHCAASRGHYDVVDLLVNTWSMMVDVVDKNLCTPLFYAVTLKHIPVIDLLIEQKSNPNHQDIKGRSVAHCAALKGYCDVLDLIKKAGGSLTLKNNIGDLPLHEAAETGKLEVCQFLLEKMTESKEINRIDDRNNCGFSPLHKAAQNNYHQICQQLISNGANVNLLTSPNTRLKNGINISNLSALDLATDSTTVNLLRNMQGKSSMELESNADGNRQLIKTQINEQNKEESNKCKIPPAEQIDKRESTPQGKLNRTNQPIRPSNRFNKDYTAGKETSKTSFESNSKTKYLHYKRNAERSNVKNLNPSTNRNNKRIQETDKSKKYVQMRYTPKGKEKSGINQDNSGLKGEDQVSVSQPAGNPQEEKLNDEERLANVVPTGRADNNKSQNIIKPSTTYSSKYIKQPGQINKKNESNYYKYSSKENRDITGRNFMNSKLGENSTKETDDKRKETNNSIKENTLKQDVQSEVTEGAINSFDRSLRPIDNDNAERNLSSNNKDSIDKEDCDILGNEGENNSNTNSNQTTTSSISSHNSDYRRNNKSKGIDLTSKIVKSVRDYESVRDRMRNLSDQRRQELFHGYSKGYNKTDKNAIKTPMKSEQSKKMYNQYSGQIDRTDFSSFDAEANKKRSLFPKAQSKEEQIRLAYEGQPSVNTLALYSYIP